MLVRPVPQHALPPSDFRPGGRYFDSAGRDLTGLTFEGGVIDVRDSTRLTVSGASRAPVARTKGAVVRANLFRRSAGWKWLTGGMDGSVLVSVQQGVRHFYALTVSFSSGITLASFPKARTEPRLRPSTYGTLALGEEIGRIMVRQREHVVHSIIEVTA